MKTTTESATLTNCPSTGGVLSAGLGADRIDAFVNSNKFVTLHPFLPRPVNNGQRSWYEFNLDEFLILLKKFPKSDYNGIRVYVARFPTEPIDTEGSMIPEGREGQLTLLFVPTQKSIGIYTGIDVPSQFWYLGPGNKVALLPEPGSVVPNEDYVTRWVGNYQKDLMLRLETDGKIQTRNSDFKETRSLWYDIRTIAGDGVEGEPGWDCGLISFIESRRKSEINPIQTLYIQFAAFVDRDDHRLYPIYQLTIIFTLQREEDPHPISDKFLPLSNAETYGSQKITIRSIPADTGIPCPPATHCPGSSIPPDL